MDPVSDLQRRTALARLGTPLYDYEPVLDGRVLCRVYVADKVVVALCSGAKRLCRRAAASKALYELFGVFSAIYIGARDPHWPYVRFVDRALTGTDEVTQLFLDSDCPVYVEQPTTMRASKRVHLVREGLRKCVGLGQSVGDLDDAVPAPFLKQLDRAGQGDVIPHVPAERIVDVARIVA